MLALLLCSPALAANFLFGGDTTGAERFNRPASVATLSAVGTDVPHDVVPFYVTEDGIYFMELLSTTSGFDPFALVYSSFANDEPLVGLINGDDDYAGALPMLGTGTATAARGSVIAPSQFGPPGNNFAPGGLELAAFQQYFAVVTGFDNLDFGSYEGAIGGGPGDAVGGLVSEPASIVLTALGLGAAIGSRRRRRRTS
jgi:hypothetical protein